MRPKKLLLAIAISLSIFVFYFGYGVEPDYTLIQFFGFKWGPNVSDYVGIKLIAVAAWFLFVLWPSKEDETDN